MKRRLFNLLAAVSLVMCMATLVMWGQIGVISHFDRAINPNVPSVCA